MPVSTEKNKGGRPSTLLVSQVKAIVEEKMDHGMNITQIAALRDTDTKKPLASYKTIEKYFHEAESKFLETDPEWFNRARLARVKAQRRLGTQLTRLYNIASAGPSENYSSAECLHAESLLTHTVDVLYSIESDFDPEQYYKELERDYLVAPTRESTDETKSGRKQISQPQSLSKSKV